jgi:hypothetical protein
MSHPEHQSVHESSNHILLLDVKIITLMRQLFPRIKLDTRTCKDRELIPEPA